MNTIKLNVIGEVKSAEDNNTSNDENVDKLLPIGRFVYTKDNKFVPLEDWDAANNSDVFGACISTGDKYVIVATTKKSYCKFGCYGIQVGGDYTNSKLDFNGVANTQRILTLSKDYVDENDITGAPAAEYCDSVIFPNGNKGYLPAYGELLLAAENDEAFKEKKIYIGGGGIIWSSNDNDTMVACAYFTGSNASGSGKNNNYIHALPFMKL